MIGGPASRDPAGFDLWRWSGEPGAPAQRLAVRGLPGLEKAEGVCQAVVGGVPRIVIVSDDGNRKTGREAGYLLLDAADLQTVA